MQPQITETLTLLMPDGQSVRGIINYTPQSHPTPVIVFAHGFGSTRMGEKSLALEAECARRGWAFAACDFRAHGASDGAMTELRGSRLLEDLDAITRAAVQRAGGPLFLVGSSMGGWASAWFAAQHPERVTACAFVAPGFRFLEFLRLNDEERQAWQRTDRLRVQNEFIDLEISYGLVAEAEKFAFAELTQAFRTPSILFHGMADDIVPYEISLAFAAACQTNLLQVWLSKDGDHRLSNKTAWLAKETCDFFAHHLSS